MARRPRVFVAHDTGTVNFYPAKRFGDISVCVDGHVEESDYDIALQEMRSNLMAAQSGDYFLPIGSPMLIAVGAIELAKRVGNIRVLQWDRFTKQYSVVEVSSL